MHPRNRHQATFANADEFFNSLLGGQILENRQKHAELSEQMRHVEAVIKLLDPGYNLGRIAVKRRKQNKWFKRGTLYRRAVDVLRTAEQPLTATEIAWKVLEAADVKEPDKKDAYMVAQGIQHSLSNHDGKGVKRVADTRPARWRIANQ